MFPQKKRNEQILLYYYETSGRLVLVRFLEEIEDTKKTFRNYLTFTRKLAFQTINTYQDPSKEVPAWGVNSTIIMYVAIKFCPQKMSKSVHLYTSSSTGW